MEPLLKMGTFGYIDPNITDFTIVLRKPVNAAAVAVAGREVMQQA